MESANLDLEENKEIASKFERALGKVRISGEILLG